MGTPTARDRRVINHQAHDLYVSSLSYYPGERFKDSAKGIKFYINHNLFQVVRNIFMTLKGVLWFYYIKGTIFNREWNIRF